MNATTAREAALHVLLEEVDPLLRQTEEIAASLKAVQAQLRSETEALASLLRQQREAQPALIELGRALNGAASRIEAAARNRPPATVVTPNGQRFGRQAGAIVGSVVLATGLLALGGWSVGADLFDQARLGRALQHAWPLLDTATRERVQAALEKR